jgi:hypothetical protein
VSNIANPTFDAELAIRTMVNAKLAKTPHRQSPPAGASELTLDSLDNKDPISKRESRKASTRQKPQVKWRTSGKVSSRSGSPARAGDAAKKAPCDANLFDPTA